MPKYTVTVFTGNLHFAHTFNNVYVKVVGENGSSDRIRISKGGFYWKSEASSELECKDTLGKLLMIELDKQPLPLFPEDNWFVDNVVVNAPDGKVYTFPIYRWIQDSKTHFYREGTAAFAFDDLKTEIILARETELKHREKEYCWMEYKPGMPYCMKNSLPLEAEFSLTKGLEFVWTAIQGLTEMKLTGLGDCTEAWTNFDDIHRVFNWHKNDASRYVYDHWREDEFFGYQYLNGLNPILIRQCKQLPENFHVTEDMVQLEAGKKLKAEMKAGNIFLCDYKILDEVKTREINNEVQYLAAPLVLLHNTTAGKLMPVAIQLNQKPGDQNPVFFPSDPEYDWLLAKTFVRSAEFNEHELNTHLLRTHLLAEVFGMALLRNVPMVHPLYKLLHPHTRYTLNINELARERLISEEGAFTQYAASGGEGMVTILQRALSSMTYSSLCIPDDIKERGMESVPNYFYRDDGLALWAIINRFVNGVITHYYTSDELVQKDPELKNYIMDIFEKGFLSKAESGIPQSFSKVDELVKFVTMVIFTCSVQHAAVNSGQLNFGNWMPNYPTSLQYAPPTEKGKANEETLLQTLPDVNVTVHGISVVWLLSKQSTDFVALGQYPQELFTEDAPRKLIEIFQKELQELDVYIETRNKGLDLPYSYLRPSLMENSVSL